MLRIERDPVHLLARGEGGIPEERIWLGHADATPWMQGAGTGQSHHADPERWLHTGSIAEPWSNSPAGYRAAGSFCGIIRAESLFSANPLPDHNPLKRNGAAGED